MLAGLIIFVLVFYLLGSAYCSQQPSRQKTLEKVKKSVLVPEE